MSLKPHEAPLHYKGMPKKSPLQCYEGLMSSDPVVGRNKTSKKIKYKCIIIKNDGMQLFGTLGKNEFFTNAWPYQHLSHVPFQQAATQS